MTAVLLVRCDRYESGVLEAGETIHRSQSG